MKTVQQTIKSIDRVKLLVAYIAIDKPQMEKNEYKILWKRFFDSLLTLNAKPKKAGERGIILGIKGIDHKVHHELIFEHEVLQFGEETEDYGYSFCEWENIMGYYVAETRYTQKHIYEIMAQVLYEMTFLGVYEGTG